MQEKRLTLRLTSFWDRIRKDDPMPSYTKLNPAMLEDVWQNCVVLKVMPSAAGKQKSFTYVHFGSEIKGATAKDLLGETLTTNMKFFPGAKIIRRIDEVVSGEAPTPLYDEGEFVNDRGAIVKYRACLLAFGAPNTGITHVLIGVSWRAFS